VTLDHAIPVGFHRLPQRHFRETEEVIPKIPVRALHELDVGTEGDEPAAGAQAAGRFAQRTAQGQLVGQMLEKVAGENDVERAVGSCQGAEQSWRRKVTSGWRWPEVCGLRSMPNLRAQRMWLMNSP